MTPLPIKTYLRIFKDIIKKGYQVEFHFQSTSIIGNNIELTIEDKHLDDFVKTALFDGLEETLHKEMIEN